MSGLKINILKLKFLYFIMLLFKYIKTYVCAFKWKKVFIFMFMFICWLLKKKNYKKLKLIKLLNWSILKYRIFNFKIWFFRPLIALVQNMTIIRTGFRICTKRKTKLSWKLSNTWPMHRCVQIFWTWMLMLI